MGNELSSVFRILIVEDSAFSAKVLQDLVEKFPWYSEKETKICRNGEAAMRYMESIKTKDLLPTLIILDLELPDAHGLDLLKKIKSNPFWKSIPVVVNSSSEKREDVIAAYKGGGAIFLRKSKDEEAFKEVVQQLRIRGLLKTPAEELRGNPFPVKKRILIVDDSPLACASCAALLEKAGYETESCSSALEAIDAAKNRHFDLILMDIIMPSIDGIEACKRIRVDEKLRNMPIIMVTVAEESNHLEKAFQAGAMDYIMKPIREFELLARLNSALMLKAKEFELATKNRELKEALDEITLLRGCLPVCAWCKKIRDIKGSWNQIEEYLLNHSNVRFSHGICEECAKNNQPKSIS